MKFKQINETKIDILNDNGDKVGHIFSPSSSGHDTQNGIQICGFSEAFDLWGCGIFKGYKDIQLLFDEKKMDGEFSVHLDGCIACYMKPCQCEKEVRTKSENPFIVKRSHDLKDRIKHVNKDGTDE